MSGNNIISYAGADPICGGENPDIIQGILTLYLILLLLLAK